jgi:hypothetical protein
MSLTVNDIKLAYRNPEGRKKLEALAGLLSLKTGRYDLNSNQGCLRFEEELENALDNLQGSRNYCRLLRSLLKSIDEYDHLDDISTHQLEKAVHRHRATLLQKQTVMSTHKISSGKWALGLSAVGGGLIGEYFVLRGGLSLTLRWVLGLSSGGLLLWGILLLLSQLKHEQGTSPAELLRGIDLKNMLEAVKLVLEIGELAATV